MTHGHAHEMPSLNQLALSATLHCLAGCGTGEILGLVIGSALGWGTGQTIALAVGLAYVFGYAFTMLPLRRSGMDWGTVFKLALAADTVSITVMEIIDNLVILVIPGAMSAGLGSLLFWGSLAASLIAAAIVVFPVNRWMIARGRGHAVVHDHH
jgi:hypothetical protein